MEARIQETALLAILEYEAIPGLSGGKVLVRSMSVISSSTPISETPDILRRQLTEYFNALNLLGVDYPVIVQVFKQVHYWFFESDHFHFSPSTYSLLYIFSLFNSCSTLSALPL